jgi:magnesium-transporting ATPase (P-type)
MMFLLLLPKATKHCFVCVHMNCLGFKILIPFSRSVVLSRFTRLLFSIAFTSHYSISITFHYVFVIVYTSMAYCTSNSKTSKMRTTSNNKCKLFSMVTLFFFFLEHLARHIHFFTYPPSFN